MKRELFRKYVWLIDLVRHHKKITFEEVARSWDEAAINIDHSPLALRTFHNHRDAIEALFGIRILCNRSDKNTYYIPRDESGLTRLKIWMLQTLSMNHITHREDEYQNRLIFDCPNDYEFILANIIEAIRDKVTIIIEYKDFDGSESHIEVGPYCTRFWRNKWYFLGQTNDGALKVFDFERILSTSATENYFEMPEDFDLTSFFHSMYGMDLGQLDDKIATCSIKIGGLSREKIRHTPLHNSQKEVANIDGHSVFSFRLYPNEDFIRDIMSMGPDAEVLAPPYLRREIKKRAEEMCADYDKRPDPTVMYKAHVGKKTSRQPEYD